MDKKCPICGELLDWKGRCSSGPCPVYRVKGRGTRGGWVPREVVFCSRPRLRPLTDLEVKALVYGDPHEIQRKEAV
ncbi:hypothetical protein ES702_05326 [subsurface metagenome]